MRAASIGIVPSKAWVLGSFWQWVSGGRPAHWKGGPGGAGAGGEGGGAVCWAEGGERRCGGVEEVRVITLGSAACMAAASIRACVGTLEYLLSHRTTGSPISQVVHLWMFRG